MKKYAVVIGMSLCLWALTCLSYAFERGFVISESEFTATQDLIRQKVADYNRERQSRYRWVAAFVFCGCGEGEKKKLYYAYDMVLRRDSVGPIISYFKDYVRSQCGDCHAEPSVIYLKD